VFSEARRIAFVRETAGRIEIPRELKRQDGNETHGCLKHEERDQALTLKLLHTDRNERRIR
jgi:hypothetical protein